MISKNIHILTDVDLAKIKKEEHVKGYNKGYFRAQKIGEQRLQSYIEKKASSEPILVHTQTVQGVEVQSQFIEIKYSVGLCGNVHSFHLYGSYLITCKSETLKSAYHTLCAKVHNYYRTMMGMEPLSITLSKPFEEWVNDGKGNVHALVVAGTAKCGKKDKSCHTSLEDDEVKEDVVKYDTIKVYLGFETRIKGYVFYSPGRLPVEYKSITLEAGFNQLRSRIYDAYKDKVNTTPASIHFNTTYEEWLNNGKPIITATVYYTSKD